MTAAEVETLRRELKEFQTTMLGRFDDVDARLELGNKRFEHQERRLDSVEKWQGGAPDAVTLIVDQMIDRTFTYQNLIKLGTLITVVNGIWFIIGRFL